ncbi:hypothetical protein D3C87_1929080 [compost metagenome]
MLEIEPADQHRRIGLGAGVQIELAGILPGIELGRQRLQVGGKARFAADLEQPLHLVAIP